MMGSEQSIQHKGLTMTKHNNPGHNYGKALRAYRTEILDAIYDFNDPTCLDGIYEECIIDLKHAWIHGNLERVLLNGAHDWLEYSRGVALLSRQMTLSNGRGYNLARVTRMTCL